MKGCSKCELFYQGGSVSCSRCGGPLNELTLNDALESTKKRSFKQRVGGNDNQIPDEYKQYHIRSYIGNQSLFLLYDIRKNRLKHGRKQKRFFVQPINVTALINIPWFFFNIISTNLFHLQYIDFCNQCRCKCILNNHSRDECDYNIEYFHILDDILSGEIIHTKKVYVKHALGQRKKGKQSAYANLFLRKAKVEAVLDIVSIGLSLAFWMYVAVYVSFPMFRVLMQKIEFYDAYKWTFF